jgi:hypothetical protein
MNLGGIQCLMSIEDCREPRLWRATFSPTGALGDRERRPGE